MQPPNPRPSIHTDPSYTRHLYATRHSPYYSDYQNPSPISHIPTDADERYSDVGLGVMPDPYLALTSYPHSHGAGGYDNTFQSSELAYPHRQPVDPSPLSVLPPVYYPGSNGGGTAVQNREALGQYSAYPYVTGGTVPPNGTEQLVPAVFSSSYLPIRPSGNGTWKRGPKKLKVVQSAWCQVCKLECNSIDVLDKHKVGKKHKKKLEKLKEATVPAPTLVNPVIGPQENALSRQKPKKKANKTVEDVETKRRKVLEGGAAAAAVRTCAICNVVCNSETVFKYHLAGKKHVSMMKKHASGTGMASASKYGSSC